jgi:hypothetical protein
VTKVTKPYLLFEESSYEINKTKPTKLKTRKCGNVAAVADFLSIWGHEIT